MKNILRFGFTIIVALMVFAITACTSPLEESKTGPVQLGTPANLQISGTTLSWSAVTNSNGYNVKVNDGNASDNGTATSFPLTMTTPGTYTISVMAYGDGVNYTDSAWADKQYIVPEASETYTITWKNWDNTTLETDNDVAGGAIPEYNGEEPTKAEDADNYYNFSGWSPALVAVSADAVYTAQFTAVSKTSETYTITWKNWDDTTLETDNNVASGVIPEYDGATPTKAEDAEYLYNFSGWLPELVAVNADAVYTAQFTSISKNSETFTITWKNHDGATLETDKVIEGDTPVYNGPAPTKPADADNTYTFSVWSPGPVAASADAVYIAQFTTVPKHTITVSANNALFGEVTGGGKYANGETVTLTAAPKTGYKFDNWTEGGAEVNTDADYSFKATKDISLVANFSMITFTVSVSANNTAFGEVTGGGEYAKDENVTLTATPKAGYQFDNWTEGGAEVSTDAAYNFKATKDISLVANFSMITFTVSVSANNTAFGEVTGSGEYAKDENVTLTATPNTGYQFVNWTRVGSDVSVSTSASYNFTVTENISLVANFIPKPPTFTILATANNPAYGTVSGAREYAKDENVTLTATPSNGYKFSIWMIGGVVVSVEDDYTFTASKDITLTAIFSEDIPGTYTIFVTANNPGWGTVTGSGNYPDGTPYDLRATPNAGYVFKRWVYDMTYNTNLPAEIMGNQVYEDRSWVAHFEPDPTSDPDGDGIPGTPEPGDISIKVVNGTGTGYYSPGETVTIETTDLMFVYWGCSDIGFAAERTVKKRTFTLAETHDSNGDGEITFTAHAVDKNLGFAVMETNSSYTVGAEYNFTYEYDYNRTDIPGYIGVPIDVFSAKIASVSVAAEFLNKDRIDPDEYEDGWSTTLSVDSHGEYYQDIGDDNSYEVKNLNSTRYVIFWIYEDYDVGVEKARVMYVLSTSEMNQMISSGGTKQVGGHNVGLKDNVQ